MKEQDKPYLYDQLLSLKQDIHTAKEENLLLKSKLNQHQQAKSKKDRTIKELQSRLRNPGLPGQLTKDKTHLLAALKGKLTEMRTENVKLRRGLKRLQKDPKLTYINELDGERKAYAEEFDRLQALIDKIENAGEFVPPEDSEVIEARLRNQDQMLKTVKTEHEKLLKELRIKENEAAKYKQMAESAEKEEKAKEDANEKMAIQQKKEIQRLQEKIDAMKETKSIVISKIKLEELRKAKEAATAKITQQQKKIAELENKIQEMQVTKNTELEKLRSKFKKHKEVKKVSEGPPIEVIVEELNANLAHKDVKPEDLRQELFEKYNDNEKVSLHELSKILKRQPCGLAWESALQLAGQLMGLQTEVVGKRRTQIMEEVPLPEVLEKLTTVLRLLSTTNQSRKKPNKIDTTDKAERYQIAQERFFDIANSRSAPYQTFQQQLSEAAILKEIDNEEVECLLPSDFFDIVDVICGLKFSEKEQASILKTLVKNNEDNLIKLDHLMTIIKRFDLCFEYRRLDPDFSELDNISAVLMHYLTEYLLDRKIPVTCFFRGEIYPLDVGNAERERKIKVIDSANFFNRMYEKGVCRINKVYDNLETFLSVGLPGKLSVKRIKRTVAEFIMNPEIRDYAKRSFQALLEEEIENEKKRVGIYKDEENDCLLRLIKPFPLSCQLNLVSQLINLILSLQQLLF
eukprot:TRINITY_DN296_c0_g1_i10.p1 TRINITY_DN296_c0_g1~~TRINITY_DN296_c0_g1_i10.p1  ORF type:complete len:687 (+),score=111.96 TRINITY_DN296_c0_g1_i10:1502-3562(+)